jgi:spore germination protein YaaH
MKKCNTELMKDLKVIQELINAARQKQHHNSTVSYTEKERASVVCLFDYEASEREFAQLQAEERHIKKLLAVSNATTKVEGYDITIAEALVLLAQLSLNKKFLSRLATKERLVRESSEYRKEVEFTKVCYDLEKAQADLAKLNKDIAKLQMALDRTNLTNLIEV